MLLELRVENLLLIERAELSLDRGLNVITGETGAGKTVLTHALDLLLGGKPRAGILRPGASEAYVEGTFAPGLALDGDPDLAELAGRLPLGEEEIVLARRVTSEGRTRAYVQGRSASAADLRLLGSRLVSFFGQHEHRKLTLASAQLDVLDGFCGRAHLEAVGRFERLWHDARLTERELVELRERAGGRERDLDLLEFELQEISEAAPVPGEEEALEGERSRLASVESLRQATQAATAAITGADEAAGEDAAAALALLARGDAELRRVSGIDARLDPIAERLQALVLEADDAARELRDYEATLDADPERLGWVEERLALLARLKRKHGGTIEAVLEHAERCRRERDRLANAGETTARLEDDLACALDQLDDAAAALHATRAEAARSLEQSVRAELDELAMADASFEVVLAAPQAQEPASDAGLDRFGRRGTDSVDFMIAPNPGVPAGRVREIASGGELSRVMLALMSVATAAEGAPAVVFDEIDAGVGGNTARAVGRKLSRVASQRQVVCVTHLPQVASLAARHFRVVKRVADGTARADVERLDRGALVGEICRMLGADSADGAARQHAERLLDMAEQLPNEQPKAA